MGLACVAAIRLIFGYARASVKYRVGASLGIVEWKGEMAVHGIAMKIQGPNTLNAKPRDLALFDARVGHHHYEFCRACGKTIANAMNVVLCIAQSHMCKKSFERLRAAALI